MFYVVFLKVPRRNVLVPNTWVYNYESQMNKDMFHGVNPAQSVLCFYSPDAYDDAGLPQIVEPNFNYPVNEVQFPNEGCYEARIKIFKVRVEDAYAFLVQQREIEPKFYSARRLKELPFPVLRPNIDEIEGDNSQSENGSEENNEIQGEEEIPNDDLNGNDTNHDDPQIEVDANKIDGNNDNLVGNEVSVENEDFHDNPQTEETIDESQNDLQNEVTAGGLNETNDDHGNVEMEDEAVSENQQVGTADSSNAVVSSNGGCSANDVVKPEMVPYVRNHAQNIAAINDLLENATEIQIDDDLAIVVSDSGVPKPFPTTKQWLVKRANDIISGNKAFNEEESGDRIYYVGEDLVAIPKKVIDAFKFWASNPEANTAHFDEVFVQTLLLTMVAPDALISSKIDDAVLEFIYDLLAIRVKDDEERMSHFYDYVNGLVEKKRKTKSKGCLKKSA